jgi:hypothetical protein
LIRNRTREKPPRWARKSKVGRLMVADAGKPQSTYTETARPLMPKKILPMVAAVMALSACAIAPRNDLTTTSTPPGAARTESRDLAVDDPRPVVAAAIDNLRNMGYEIDPSAGDGRTVVA